VTVSLTATASSAKHATRCPLPREEDGYHTTWNLEFKMQVEGDSMTLRAMLAGTYVPGRASQAGQTVKEKPDYERQTGPPRRGFCGWAGNPPK
jgi:hypothetical protein